MVSSTSGEWCVAAPATGIMLLALLAGKANEVEAGRSDGPQIGAPRAGNAN